jgi:hypothetical protein
MASSLPCGCSFRQTQALVGTGRGVVFRTMPVRAASTSASYEKSTTTTLPPVPENVHRVVLMRHGESKFNNANVSTGWCDVALPQRRIVEN